MLIPNTFPIPAGVEDTYRGPVDKAMSHASMEIHPYGPIWLQLQTNMVMGIVPFLYSHQQLIQTGRVALATHYPKTDKAAAISLTLNRFVPLKSPPAEEEEDNAIQQAISAIGLTLQEFL